MGTKIQLSLHPDGSPAITDQEMTDGLKKILQVFYRTEKGATPTSHPRPEKRISNPLITEPQTQQALEALYLNKSAGPRGFFLKALKT